MPVMPTDVAELDEDGIMGILEAILFEFPVSEVNIGLPRWIEELDDDHWLRAKFEDAVHAGDKPGPSKDCAISISRSRPYRRTIL